MKKFALAVILTAGLVATGFTTSSASAATITVDTTNMTSQAGGDGVANECSVIDALEAANSNVAVNGCVAGDPVSVASDTIYIPSGTYINTSFYGLTMTESVSFVGAGSSETIIESAVTLNPQGSTPADISIHDMTFNESTVGIENSSMSAPATVTISDIILHESRVNIFYIADYPIDTALNNIDGRNGSLIRIWNGGSNNPGTTTLTNTTLDGAGINETAIVHSNYLANDTVTIQNSVITDYGTAISNEECYVDMVNDSTLHLINSSIGGGNMQTGIRNVCGHLVVDSSTFHDIAGRAILAETNHAMIYTDNSIETCSENIQYASSIELTNNTFTSISATQVDSAPAGIVALDSTLEGICPVQSLTTESQLLMNHNTFTGNTLGPYANVSVTDGTLLKDLTVQNNALEGEAVHGTFSVSGSVVGDNNFSTVAYTGPSVLGAAFKLASTFDLTPLTGSTPVGVNNTGGYLTMFRPMWGSPLLDSGSDVGVDTDQRNGPRSLLKQYDIGAVEVTRAEVLGDGVTEAQLAAYLGETSPATPNTSAGAGDSDTELANTGAPIALYVAGAVGMSTAGGYALSRQRR